MDREIKERMMNTKHNWTAEEEAALRAGVAKYGTGKWVNILNNPHYEQLDFEAISSLGDVNGLDINAIQRIIEQNHDQTPKNFRKFLRTKLGKLLLQEKLEKVDNSYKLKEDLQNANENDNDPWLDYAYTLEGAASIAANKIAVSENLSRNAEQAVKKLERVEKYVEENMAVLQLVEELYSKYSTSADGIALRF